MPGLVVVGATPTADTVGVAVALCEAAKAAGHSPAVRIPVAAGPDQPLEALADAAGADLDQIAPLRFTTAAAPIIAADHHNEELHPRALVRNCNADGEAFALIVLPGGAPLVPLTPRYSVRELLRELELPVVIASASNADTLATARQASETLRAAGLAVPAVILAGWPDPPDRVQRDERLALQELVGVPVFHLGDGKTWPLDEWTAAKRGGQATSGVATPTGGVLLEPYEEWETEEELPDPREAPRPLIMDALYHIAATEGPVTATRAFRIYARYAGGRKLTNAARTPLQSATYWLAQASRIALIRADDAPWQNEDVLRAPDSPAVRVRELGPRTLDEVPLDEIAELMRLLIDARGDRDPAALKRGVLETYGLTRLTAKADAYLDLALGLLE